MEKNICEFVKPNKAIDIRVQIITDSGNMVNKHYHDWIEIMYVVKGSMDFYDNMGAIHLGERDFIVVNPLSIHSTRCLEEHTVIMLQIPTDFLKKIVSDIELYHFQVNPQSNEPGTMVKLDEIRDLMQELFLLYEEREQGYLFYCYGLVFSMFYILFHSFSRKVDYKFQVKVQKNTQRMRQIMGFINARYREELNLNMAAEAAGLNPVYFSRYFKEQMGITYLEYLNTVRLEHIHEDLLAGDYKIQDLQKRHGFHNYKLFMYMFKTIYGCTPKELRKSVKEKGRAGD